jgi:hypothetical protein
VLFFYALIEEINGRKVYWREIKWNTKKNII